MDRNSQPVRILIAEEQPIFRYGLRALLQAEPDFRVVAETAVGQEAVQLTRELKPDVLLLDLDSSPGAGAEIVRQVSGAIPSLNIILFTEITNRDGIVQALQLGARGVILKNAPTRAVVKSIRCVLAGEYWIARENIGDLVQVLRAAHEDTHDNGNGNGSGNGHGSGNGNGNAKPKDGRPRLTPRETEIVSSIVAGFTNKDIAQKFRLSEDTVKHHLTNIFDKLGVSNRLELALLALGKGLVPAA